MGLYARLFGTNGWFKPIHINAGWQSLPNKKTLLEKGESWDMT